MKRKILCLMLAFALCLSACGSKDPLDAIEGANSTQKAAIQDVLDECGISVKSCSAATVDKEDNELENAIVDALTSSFTPYEVVAEDGNVYRMVIKKADYSILSITDHNGEFVYGGLGGLLG